MSADLAAAIRAHLDQRPVRHLDPALESAVLGVVDKCEQMRAESGDGDGYKFFAAEFERVIADALGINHS